MSEAYTTGGGGEVFFLAKAQRFLRKGAENGEEKGEGKGLGNWLLNFF